MLQPKTTVYIQIAICIYSVFDVSEMFSVFTPPQLSGSILFAPPSHILHNALLCNGRCSNWGRITNLRGQVGGGHKTENIRQFYHAAAISRLRMIGTIMAINMKVMLTLLSLSTPDRVRANMLQLAPELQHLTHVSWLSTASQTSRPWAASEQMLELQPRLTTIVVRSLFVLTHRS